ncbi:MAG: N-formylglutamate amidohydrolase [Alphaproteobacteria bacterium]
MPDSARHNDLVGGPAPALLGPDDPAPYEILRPEAGGRVLLICDHASRVVPTSLDRLGLDDAVLRRHIGWDIGAGDVTRRLAELLDAPAVLGGFSRLVIDNNRGLDDPTSIPEISDGVLISGNRGISDTERRARVRQVFEPYHDAIEDMIERLSTGGVTPVLLSVHTFTPVMRGVERPWHFGLLWTRDPRVARPLIERLGDEPGVVVGDNEPYSARDGYGFSMERHAAERGYPHALIELRQDLIDTPKGVALWTERLHRALRDVLADESIYRVMRNEECPA